MNLFQEIVDICVTNFTVITSLLTRKKRRGKHVCEDGVAEGLSPKWLLPSSAVLLSPASPDRKLLPLCCSSSSASSAFQERYCRAMSLYFKRNAGRS